MAHKAPRSAAGKEPFRFDDGNALRHRLSPARHKGGDRGGARRKVRIRRIAAFEAEYPNIKVTLPNSVPIASDVLGQMPDVTLSYAGINLINSNNTSDFTVEGFEVTSRSNIENSADISSKIANQVEL